MTIPYPKLSEEIRLSRLEAPRGKVQLVLDTDTYNEIDDQFAVAYTLLSKDRIELKAIYAAPFVNELAVSPADGMEKSYEEIYRILARMGEPADGNFVFRGSDKYLPGADEPVDSPAARDLVARAMAASPNEPLYVAAIGAITNVASAILLEPRIIEKIVVVWLGGHAHYWNNTKEFNLVQDIPAARVIFDSGVPIIQIPCFGVSSHLITTLAEIDLYVRGRGSIGDFLAERYEGCARHHKGYSRVIWDISVIGWFIEPDWVPTEIVHSPIVTDEATWSINRSRHLMRCARFLSRDGIFRDFFRKLEGFSSSSAQRG